MISICTLILASLGKDTQYNNVLVFNYINYLSHYMADAYRPHVETVKNISPKPAEDFHSSTVGQLAGYVPSIPELRCQVKSRNGVVVAVVVVVVVVSREVQGYTFNSLKLFCRRPGKITQVVVSTLPSTMVKCENGSETGHPKVQVHG